jgi:hypothetical protein
MGAQGEKPMRTAVLSVVAAIGASLLTPAYAADVYPPPAYGAAPPPPYVQAPPPPPAYGPPPAIAYGPPVYARPRGIIAAPEGPAYDVSQPAYQAGSEYLQGPALVDGRRYYRECWWEWGYTRCALRSRWVWW